MYSFQNKPNAQWVFAIVYFAYNTFNSLLQLRTFKWNTNPEEANTVEQVGDAEADDDLDDEDWDEDDYDVEVEYRQ